MRVAATDANARALRVVVIGAGPSGTLCAERLAQRGASVTLVGDEPGLPYDRVALSRFLAGDIAEADLTTHSAEHLAALGIQHIHGTLAVGINRIAKLVALIDGRDLPYDAVVLALGSDPVRPPLAGLDQTGGICSYRTLDDVRTMLRAATSASHTARTRAVVIGGGLLGLEAAHGLARRGMSVTVLHAADRLLNRQLDGEAASRLRAHMEQGGVTVTLQARSDSLAARVAMGPGGRPEAVVLDDAIRVAADIVVLAVGIRPRVGLAREAGLAVARGVLVDEQMRTSDPAISAIGECAEFGGMCCGLVAPALAQAEVAARVLAGEAASYRPQADATALKVAGAPVWSAGEIAAEDTESIVLDEPEGAYRRLFLRDDRLVGAVMWGDTDDAAFYRNLIIRNQDISTLRTDLAFGAAFAPPELRP